MEKSRMRSQDSEIILADGFFVERKPLLKEIHIALSRQAGPVVLTGRMGCGKTTLALLYERRFGSSYPRVARVSMATLAHESSLVERGRSAVEYLAGRMLLPVVTDENLLREEPLKLFAGLARRRKNRPLLIVDDIDVLAPALQTSILEIISRVVSGVAILLLTRGLEPWSQPEKRAPLNMSRIVVHPFSKGELEEILRRRLTATDISTNWVELFLREIRSRNSGTPLSLRSLLKLAHLSQDRSLDAAIDVFVRSKIPEATDLVVLSSSDGLRAVPALRQDLISVPNTAHATLPGAPYLLVPGLAIQHREALDQFERLLNKDGVREQELQDFFEQNPSFLRSVDYSDVVAQPVLQRDDNGPLIPDFVLRPISSNLGDLLDLKTPDQPLVTGSKNRRRLSQKVQDGVAQLRTYRDHFEVPDHRAQFQVKYGFKMFRPRATLIIGRRPESVSEEEYRQILDSQPSYLQINTFDDLWERMKRQVELYGL